MLDSLKQSYNEYVTLFQETVALTMARGRGGVTETWKEQVSTEVKK